MSPQDDDDYHDGWLVRVGRIILIVGCIVLTTIGLVSAVLVVYYGGEPSSQLYAYLECLYILIQIVVGLYAALYRSREAMLVFSLASALNTVLLLISLLVKVQEQRNIVVDRQLKANFTCCDQIKLPWLLCGSPDTPTIAGTDILVRTLLWFLSAFNVFLALLSALLAMLMAPKLTGTQLRPLHYITTNKSRTPTKQRSPPTNSESKPSQLNTASYRPQPVHLISQMNRQLIPQLQQAAKSPVKTSSPRRERAAESTVERTLESIKPAPTRVE